MPYTFPKGMRDKISEVLGPHIFTVAKEDALMQAAVAVLDAQQEAMRHKFTMEAVRAELRTLAAIMMKQRGVPRLVITKDEFRIAQEHEVEASTPEPGIRIYELKRKMVEEPKVILNG
jgi:hypothetical protein